jgi:hypothetical protein
MNVRDRHRAKFPKAKTVFTARWNVPRQTERFPWVSFGTCHDKAESGSSAI